MELYQNTFKEYFLLTRTNIEKENAMHETSALLFVINDIIMSEEYSLEGVANYTQIPEEVICDIISGKNKTPSLHISRKLINLHRTVRPDVYKKVIEKIKTQYLETN
jgi:hypothetical protein